MQNSFYEFKEICDSVLSIYFVKFLFLKVLEWDTNMLLGISVIPLEMRLYKIMLVPREGAEWYLKYALHSIVGK